MTISTLWDSCPNFIRCLPPSGNFRAMLIQNPFPVTAIILWITMKDVLKISWLVSLRTTTATPGAFCKVFVDSSAHIQPATTSNTASTVAWHLYQSLYSRSCGWVVYWRNSPANISIDFQSNVNPHIKAAALCNQTRMTRHVQLTEVQAWSKSCFFWMRNIKFNIWKLSDCTLIVK